MLWQRTGKTGPVPSTLCKTSIISVGTSEYSNEVRCMSSKFLGNEATPFHSDYGPSLRVVKPVQRKAGQDHQDKWEARIKMVAEEALSDKLNDIVYHHNDCKQLCTSLSKIIHDKLKIVTDYEFKIIVLSFLGELKGEGIEAATQCTWEPQRDIMVTAYFKNETVFAMTNVILTRVGETLV